MTAHETIKRTNRIEKIEESGFSPATFVSTRGSKRNNPEVNFSVENFNYNASLVFKKML